MTDYRGLLRFYVRLTPRQRDVLQLVSLGLSNQEIAERLFIAPSVVAGHLTAIYEQMAAEVMPDAIRPNRYHAVRYFAGFFEQYPELDNRSP
jgi:DNA-binding NarL/FixJ family response regulator